MAMSRKHFRAFAEAMADVRPPSAARSCYEMWRRMRDALARVMRADNSAFRRSTFDEWTERGKGDPYWQGDE